MSTATRVYLAHDELMADLDRFTSAVRRTPSGERLRWHLLAAEWTRVAEAFARHREDESARWALLRPGAGPDDRAVLDALEAEQEAIGAAVTLCAALLHRLVRGGDDPAAEAVAIRVAALRESVGRHLSHVEADALPLVDRASVQLRSRTAS